MFSKKERKTEMTSIRMTPSKKKFCKDNNINLSKAVDEKINEIKATKEKKLKSYSNLKKEKK